MPHDTVRHEPRAPRQAMSPATPALSAVAVTLALALVLAPGLLPAEAKECRDETPLPADVRLVPPSSDVPQALARFAGAWIGTWTDKQGAGGQCHALVVEEVLPQGHARIVYSVGTHEPWNSRLPRFWRATGRITGDTLRVLLPTPDRPAVTYQFDAGILAATYRTTGRARLARLDDVTGAGCRRQVGAHPAPPPGATSRGQLTAAELLDLGLVPDGPVHNDFFLPVGRSAPALHAFKGTLTVGASRIASALGGCLGLPTPAPAFTAAFVSDGEDLVPVLRTIPRPPGAMILSPGRIWSEPGDGGLSRASFPFVVVDQLTNVARNGVATFLYDDAKVSALRFQVVQETDAWAKVDYWGQVRMAYTAGPIDNEQVLRSEFAEERRRQARIEPWSALPASAAAVLSAFDGEATPEDVSASGLVMDGILYVHGCNTRFGPFPYCRHMRHGVFSVTKSLGAAVALFRLAQKYGDGVLDAKIKDYVTVTAAHDGWERVTFADALNMATGIGDSAPHRAPPVPSPDENRPKMFEWLRARTAKAKLDLSFTYGKYPWGPGEVVRYNSTHTFVLAAAMDAFLKRREGPDAHLWDLVVDEVFRPIGILHAPMMHTLEPDGRRGVPLMAFGLYPTVDDVAKLVSLFQSGGRFDGRQILSAGRVAEALFRTAVPGLPTGRSNRFGEERYHLSFWSVPYRTATGCAFQIPYMAGYGGNFVVLLPNGISTFRFADGFDSDLESMVLAGEALRPFCSSAPADARSPSPGPPLTESEVRAALSGKRFRAGTQELYLEAGGRLYLTSGDDIDVGAWHVMPDGRYCRTWNVGDGRRLRCYTLHRAGATLELYVEGRWGKVALERVGE